MIYGELPSRSELRRFTHAVTEQMCIHGKLIEFYESFQNTAHPMAIMVGVVGALSAFLHTETDVNVKTDREKAVI